ncbi:MAG: hypothetical protein K9G61_07355 [Bacteroidales bacterium]|nr:hypothetical protein [Bacteroidales bacterium]
MQNSIVIIVIAYLLVVLATSLLSTGRRISFVSALAISLFFTPLIGLIAVLSTDHILRKSRISTHYYCPVCKREYPGHQDFCPTCLTESKHIKLTPTKHMQFI